MVPSFQGVDGPSPPMAGGSSGNDSTVALPSPASSSLSALALQRVGLRPPGAKSPVGVGSPSAVGSMVSQVSLMRGKSLETHTNTGAVTSILEDRAPPGMDNDGKWAW